MSSGQKQRIRAQQLLAQAHKVLDEAVRLSLKHTLPAAFLADASFNLLECAGLSNTALAGQHLALYQVQCNSLLELKTPSDTCASSSFSCSFILIIWLIPYFKFVDTNEKKREKRMQLQLQQLTYPPKKE